MKTHIQSPLRYPGGKSRTAIVIASKLGRCRELRSPFCGGASVELRHLSAGLSDRLWLNDADPWVASFWRDVAQRDLREFARWCDVMRRDFKVWGDRQEYGRQGYGGLLRSRLGAGDEWTPCHTAIAFALNRATYNGCLAAGGFSNYAGSGHRNDRFTRRAIARAVWVGRSLARYQAAGRYRVSCADFEVVLDATGDDVAIYLDPPYEAQAASNLYRGHKDTADGSLLDRVAAALLRCRHRWVLSVEDSARNRDRFARWQIHPAEWIYSSTGDRKVGKELIIISEVA